MKIKLQDGTEKEETAEEISAREAAATTTEADKAAAQVISAEDQAKADAEYWKNIALQQKVLIDRVSTRQDTVERRVEEVSKPAAPSKDDLNKQFWTDPTTVVRGMLDEMISPLKNFVAESRTASAYDRLKSQFRSDPNYAKVLSNPKAEAALDQLMQGQKEINEGSMRLGLMSIAGAIALNQLPDVTFNDERSPNTETTKVSQANMTLPPHLRPSAPRAPDSVQKPANLRELTETEERMRKESGLTHADFLGLINLQSHEVVDSKIGVPAKGGK